MNEIDEIIIARLKTKSGQPVLIDPVDFADEVVSIVKTAQSETTRYPLSLRFAWSFALSSVIALIGILWDSTAENDDSDKCVYTFIENKQVVSEQTISDISATINLVEQYKSCK